MLLYARTQDGQHYQAVLADGSMGLIHSSLVLQREPIQLHPMPWFHSSISRLDAEKLLDRNWDGQFLLRTSQNTKGVFALAIRYEHGKSLDIRKLFSVQFVSMGRNDFLCLKMCGTTLHANMLFSCCFLLLFVVVFSRGVI